MTNALIGTNPKPGIGKFEVRTSMSDAAVYELTMLFFSLRRVRSEGPDPDFASIHTGMCNERPRRYT